MRYGIALGALACAAACASTGESPPAATTGGDKPAPETAAPAAASPVVKSPEEGWGIVPVSLRPSFGGTMLDFRYKVVDADKARPLFDRKIKPYLFDPASGEALGMPEDGKLGALRASPRNPPVNGKHYYVLFTNGYGTVKRGNKVTIVIGDCRIDDVLVE
jgi:hypothetical protein